ncbi:TonB-dependent receptor [Hydrogenimonas cancrithermarum]|uniref:TonB-dependent receptor n=1 Tax=Hydrogenimonas cancrithermarum TaxID=2993563 RepID=A0ABM8FHM4_9BACT|nr:hypothetical protein [Hydrogenimonas cancrithermarum]BDY11718.1 hypothetical protein HCR_00300 [Hydrogenimonas cancrithermarum]
MKFRFLTFALFAIKALLAQENIDTLLGEYAQKADLSVQTKKESAGFLIVYTRQDLERMQIRQLKELIEKVPFIRYNEDRHGYSDPFYAPYQPSATGGIRIYINDRALTTPFTGNGLKLFGHMDMGYIDHAEIYLGIPSQTFGVEGAAFVIKLYTKDPARENTSLTGAMLGSRGTQDFYGYTANVTDSLSYLAYLDYRNLKRNRIDFNGNTLSRDRETGNFYGEIKKGNHRFELQAIRNGIDNLMGKSCHIDPLDPHTDADYLYGGWYYEDDQNGLKAFLNFSDTVTDHFDNSKTVLGFTALPPGVPYLPYKSLHLKMSEQFSDAQLRKIYGVGNFSTQNGIQARYKRFTIDTIEIDGTEVRAPREYNREIILSLFSENHYLIDDENLLLGSVKIDRYLENGDIRDRTLFSGRAGYIFNSGEWVSKTFFMYADFAPTMESLYTNRYLYNQTEDPKNEATAALASKLIYNTKKDAYALLASRTVRRNTIYFSGEAITNFSERMVYDSFLFEYTHRFDALNTFYFQAWGLLTQYNNELPSKNTYGSIASITNTLDRFDVHNEVVYKYNPGQKPGWDLNMAVTYHHSRRLTFFLKANNILGKALKTDYYAVDPFNGIKTELDDVDLFDRRVWAGVEYQF